MPVYRVSRASMFQSPAVLTVRVGDRAVLTCSQNVRVYPGASINWFIQSGRGRLQFVYTTSKFMPSKGRFSGILDKDPGNYALVIENVQQNDSGIYVCAAQLDSRFGNGSKLVVTAGPVTIFLLSPPSGEIHQTQPVPLVCVVRGASSDSVQIHWNISGDVSKGLVDSGTFDPDGSYSVRSRFQISAERWLSGAVCTCVAGDLTSDGVAAQKELPVFTTDSAAQIFRSTQALYKCGRSLCLGLAFRSQHPLGKILFINAASRII
ncbi:Ig heavy chain Mem5-like [Amblyraja radiata]|uniref:Ig heavy chain Mem5-like n=1 Tax=Amblyraja radiata TaxID=386614 RepID=UPI001403CE07|nr:Ig heavy chain Mem5-like [Amblyraja radiata]